MSKTKSPKKQSTTASEFILPPLPSLLTKPLGLEGWSRFEPVLVAALITEEPLLLIGSHGTAKSFFLERLAQTIGREYRFYNASLINYDDLVGIPLPSEDRTKLEFISVRSSIWDAEIVFFDEINRTRPDLQNKLFPIIHERRVQGIDLDKLHYRWAAMNPPPSAEEVTEDVDIYYGTEPLDPALADRFSFIIEVPSWGQLSDEGKRYILRDQYSGAHPFSVQPEALIKSATEKYNRLVLEPPRALEDYLIHLLSLLENQHLRISTRRATILHRNIMAVHAARCALYQEAHPELPYQGIDWNDSALMALNHSLPQIAEGIMLDPVTLLAAHRQAWEISQIDTENPWRQLLQISDPLERCIVAIEMGDKIKDEDLSQLLLDSISAQQDDEFRLVYELIFYLSTHEKRDLRATVVETLAKDLRPVLKIDTGTNFMTGSSLRARCKKAESLVYELRNSQPSSRRDLIAANLISALIAEQKFETATPHQVYGLYKQLWNRLIEPN